MSKENTSTRLKALMKERKLKQVDILEKAKLLGAKYDIKFNKSDISQYVSGSVIPGQEKLSILAEALNVNEVWLMGYEVSRDRGKIININYEDMPSNIYPIQGKKQVPLLGTIGAGFPSIVAEEQVEYLVANEFDIEAHFALKIKGDSMINARIHDGDIVFIRQQPDVEDGEIAAVLIDGEATLKRVYKMPGRVQLRAENPMYSPMDFTESNCNDFKILGKAVGFQSKLF